MIKLVNQRNNLFLKLKKRLQSYGHLKFAIARGSRMHKFVLKSNFLGEDTQTVASLLTG